ncbi:MAG: hypothetical protein A2W80_05020 [Candidatus Riflebacteria bacterium GWC2_50_8]|nr:MAG: hypothetical protein A2W80_05020 [Candidatus Riflebacteria bacterium GWC2_50_8]
MLSMKLLQLTLYPLRNSMVEPLNQRFCRQIGFVDKPVLFAKASDVESGPFCVTAETNLGGRDADFH